MKRVEGKYPHSEKLKMRNFILIHHLKLQSASIRYRWFKKHQIQFDDWNQWRKSDGFLCRSDTDCMWIDPEMLCHEGFLNFTPQVFINA